METPVVSRVRQLISDGSPLSEALSQVADEFDTSPDSVRGHYYRAGGNQTRAHGNQLLTNDQSQTLLTVALAFSGANVAWNKQVLALAVKTLFDITPNSKWCRRWIKANVKALTPRKSKHLSKKRSTATMLGEVGSFLNAVEDSQQYLTMKASNVVNYDETRVCVSSEGEILLEKRGKERSNAHGQSATTLGSLLPFVAADGKVLCSFWILKAAFSTDATAEVDAYEINDSYELRGTWPRFVGFTETGYVNSIIFDKCVRQFIDIWCLKNPGQHVWVFGDQLACHSQLAITRYALDKKVSMWLLPSNTSHFLQPLDHIVFAAFKALLRRTTYLTSLQGLFSGQTARNLFFKLALDAELEAFTPRVIETAFRETGVFPWSPAKIISHAEANSGIFQNPAEDHVQRAVAAATQVVKVLADGGDAKGRTVRKHRVTVVENELHSPTRRLQYADDAEELHLAKKKLRDERAADQLAAKKEREISNSQNTCLEPDCGRISRGGKLWRICPTCQGKFCPEHRASAALHTCTPAHDASVVS